MKKTKLVGTIGPASDNKEVLTQLIANGLNVVRLNMSHGTYEEQKEKIDLVREIDEELDAGIAIMLDTKGPEVRTGEFEDGVELIKGDFVTITMDDVIGTKEQFTVSYKGLVDDLEPGNTILLDDGYVALKVVEETSNTLKCEILNSGLMKSRRGVNVPGVNLNFDFMSEKDKQDIKWAHEMDLDFIAASFVRHKEDLKEIISVLEEVGNTNIQIISKIESQGGVDNLDEIIELSDGIMVARGDLGVEVPAEEVPVIQKCIINKCNHAGKVVITATQMLESMQSNPRPTRAEVSDVFNAVTDGSDSVMLSGESAAGQYPVESVFTQGLIASRAETAFDYVTYLRRVNRSLEPNITNVVAYSTVAAADVLKKVELIIAITESGNTARVISQLKPQKPILAITNSDHVRRGLALSYGVITAKLRKRDDNGDAIQTAIDIAKQRDLVKPGDEVVISAGSIYEKGQTSVMKIIEVK